jgi:hypothetical protein
MRCSSAFRPGNITRAIVSLIIATAVRRARQRC